jgi:hypothetical protein
MREEVERAVGTGHETIEAGADEDGCFHGRQLLSPHGACNQAKRWCFG